MKAAVLYENFQPLVVEELELDAPHEHEVLVKLTASGVCHSDLHYMKGDREHPLPVVLGHEGAGIVEEIGEGVTFALVEDESLASPTWSPPDSLVLQSAASIPGRDSRRPLALQRACVTEQANTGCTGAQGRVHLANRRS